MIFRVTLQTVMSQEDGKVVDAQGRALSRVLAYHPEQSMTCEAADEASASAFIVEHNPGAKILKVEKA